MNNKAEAIGAVRFTNEPSKSVLKTGSGGLLLQARDLSFRFSMGNRLVKTEEISDVSFHIEPGELVSLLGPTGAGKTLLLSLLAGLRKPMGGDVRLDGVDLYANRRVFSAYIGFVPAEPALHGGLTVAEILRDEARLRLPAGTSRADRLQRIDEQLSALGLGSVSGVRFGALTALQKRLVSIAVELLNHPGLLLIDQPAEAAGLADELQVTTFLQQISLQGHTIVQATEYSRCAQTADKVILLTGAGELAWFGPPAEALAYFHNLAPADSGLKGAPSFGFEDVYEMLRRPPDAETTWPEKCKAQPAYQAYVDDPLHDKRPDLLLQDRPLARMRGGVVEKQPPPRVHPPSALSCLALLAWRGTRLLTRERAGLLMLLAPPLIALTDFFIASPSMADPLLGDPGQTPVALGLVVFLNMLVSAMLFQREVIKERPVIRREQRGLSLAVPYALSKVWLVGLLALYQGLVWSLAHLAASGLMGGLGASPGMWLTLSLSAFIGGLIGLIVSTLVRSLQAAPLWTLALIVPQLLLSGSIIPLSHLGLPAQVLSTVSPSRYAFETLLTLSGYGKDIAADVCWQLPGDQRMALSDVQKKSCICMGENIFSRCNFPGIHQFFSFVIEQPRPTHPETAGDLTSLPLPPTPQPGESLDQYSQAINSYSQQLGQLQSQSTTSSAGNQQFEDSLSEWQRMRSLVIGNAEGVIAEAVEHYRQAYKVDPTQHWLVLSAMSLGLIFLLAIFQTRRGSSV